MIFSSGARRGQLALEASSPSGEPHGGGGGGGIDFSAECQRERERSVKFRSERRGVRSGSNSSPLPPSLEAIRHGEPQRGHKEHAEQPRQDREEAAAEGQGALEAAFPLSARRHLRRDQGTRARERATTINEVLGIGKTLSATSGLMIINKQVM